MRTAALAFTLLLASAASAGEVFIPAVYRGPGAGQSVWRTEITVANITTSPVIEVVDVTVTLHRPDGTTSSFSTPFAPQETLTIPDALAQWFDVVEGGGLVRVSWDSEVARITARARIYNVTENGEYGQGVPGVAVDRLVSDYFLTGLSGVDGNRTNIGISNPHEQNVMFWITLYDTSGLARGAFASVVPPRSYRQFDDIFSHFQAGPLNAATIRVTGADGTIYPWASIVRNDTGDPTFVTPAP